MLVPTKDKSKKVYRIAIVDGANAFIRNFSVREDVTTSGDPCGGVVGVLRFLGSYVEQWCPDLVIVVWEQGGGSPRRKKLFPEYKAHRTKVSESRDIDTTLGKDPESLPNKKWIKDDKENKLSQLLTLTEVLKTLPVCQVFVPDCECDDVVGYLVREHYHTHRDMIDTITVLSTDKDFYQLLTYPEVRIWDPMKKVLITDQMVLDTYKISPENFVLGKAIVGDNSDNIPGVYGIGWKTVAKDLGPLLETRQPLGVSDILDWSKAATKGKKKVPKTPEKLLASEDILHRNVRLMELESSITLTHGQVSKAKYQVESFVPRLDKLTLIKTLLRKGIVTNIDYDRLHTAWRTLLIQTQQYYRELQTGKTITKTD